MRHPADKLPGADFNLADARAMALGAVPDTLYMEAIAFGWRFYLRSDDGADGTSMEFWYDPNIPPEDYD